MNKASEISKYKKLFKAAEDMEAVSMQNFSLATRLKSEAKSALDGLGVQPERTRKGEFEIPAEMRLKLQAGLTKKVK